LQPAGAARKPSRRRLLADRRRCHTGPVPCRTAAREDEIMAGALAGVRVIEIGQEIQGPYAGLLLADLGAEVIKVERPEAGDPSRHMRIGVIAGAGARNAEFSHYFLAMNRGKRSITLDLKHPEAQRVLDRLLSRADVLLTNYRPGVLERIGFGYPALHARFPRLIYAAGSSWGPEGPWARRPSRDTLAQAAGGLMAKNGTGDHPLPCGALVADHSAAITLANGILAALFARERSGRGQRVDASIYGTVLALQPMEIDFTSLSGLETARAERGHQFLHGVWGAFRTRNGWICLAGVDDKRWPDFCRALGIESLRHDADCDAVGRNYHGTRIERALDEVFPRRTTQEWMKELEAIDVLATPVRQYAEILGCEQARANGYVQEMEHPSLGMIRTVGNPIRLSDTPLETSAPPPELGQHTEEILLENGYGWPEIEELRGSGALSAATPDEAP
jgi:crotonobetainyl-CoA:carnitine CoA-transferase CaiB-like acyl-CoA transferase